ncbi:nuclear transport factor 2 family protein [Bacillus sp. Xin]|uniref:nuclear transport factor 2 family protein n=1 Tax=unclassified Bacillus (in: firmicutes) TaxID=185979 RepID=UPI0015743DD2|nr:MULTISPECIES: nuclear transport factor 2 family protein [unclassified Bacillus (in: firmicutes)]MBC6976192.1 nuclear transport factor 2 family protein [Bacillus sp. Xin]NSW39572.1 nuclear transport factor 2 family protein [Bacillus sp. Xin1]
MDKNLIYEYEEKLRNAMVNGDVEILERLISDELSFVSPFGQIITKEDDINSHRSGIVNLTEIKFLNQKVIPLEDVAVTITQAKVKAIIGGQHREDEMYYTRVWKKDKDELKVISGHCSFVQK